MSSVRDFFQLGKQDSPSISIHADEGSWSVQLVGGPPVPPSCKKKPLSPLTILLEGQQGFRSHDQTMMEFKNSPCYYEAHVPNTRTRLQLAHHPSHSEMAAPFLFLSTVSSIPLEI